MSRYRLTPLSVGLLHVAPVVLITLIAPNRDALFWVLVGRVAALCLLHRVRTLNRRLP